MPIEKITMDKTTSSKRNYFAGIAIVVAVMLCSVTGLGHRLMEETPQTVIPALIAFLNE